VLPNKQSRDDNFFGKKLHRIPTHVSPFAGISFDNDEFNNIGLTQLNDNELGTRVETIGFSYSDIIRNLINIFLAAANVMKIFNHAFVKHFVNIPIWWVTSFRMFSLI
jgi:hypothetical protein